MLNVMAIGGVPATGKTTLMFEIIKQTDDWVILEPEKLVNVMYSEKLQLHIIGKYEQDGNQFQGTDRLSMAVQPQAEKFISSILDKNLNVIFEGDRLFNSKFLDYVQQYSSKFSILILTTEHKINEQRHVDRKDSQDEKFKKSRQTKINNISSSLFLQDYIRYMVNNNHYDQKIALQYINSFFGWSD